MVLLKEITDAQVKRTFKTEREHCISYLLVCFVRKCFVCWFHLVWEALNEKTLVDEMNQLSLPKTIDEDKRFDREEKKRKSLIFTALVCFSCILVIQIDLLFCLKEQNRNLVVFH